MVFICLSDLVCFLLSVTSGNCCVLRLINLDWTSLVLLERAERVKMLFYCKVSKLDTTMNSCGRHIHKYSRRDFLRELVRHVRTVGPTDVQPRVSACLFKLLRSRSQIM